VPEAYLSFSWSLSPVSFDCDFVMRGTLDILTADFFETKGFQINVKDLVGRIVSVPFAQHNFACPVRRILTVLDKTNIIFFGFAHIVVINKDAWIAVKLLCGIETHPQLCALSVIDDPVPENAVFTLPFTEKHHAAFIVNAKNQPHDLTLSFCLFV